MHRTYLGGIERGERNPSYTNIVRIAGALGMAASELLAEAERIGGEDLASTLPAHPAGGS
jgi:transcriptional regulator with XRE-family HTH domain